MFIIKLAVPAVLLPTVTASDIAPMAAGAGMLGPGSINAGGGGVGVAITACIAAALPCKGRNTGVQAALQASPVQQRGQQREGRARTSCKRGHHKEECGHGGSACL